MAYIGQNADGNFTTSVSKDTFSGNGSATAFTLSEAATTNTVDVFVENIRQEPTTAYSVDGTTLTFTAAPVTGTNNIYVVNRGPIQLSASHPAAQSLSAFSATITNDLTVDTNTLFVDASENKVGIGTTTVTDGGVTITPSVTRAGDWDAKLALQSTAGSDFPALLFSGSNTTQYGGIVGTTDTSGNVANNRTAQIAFLQSSATAGNITFSTNGNVGTTNVAERMRIDSAGHVGLGTTSPQGDGIHIVAPDSGTGLVLSGTSSAAGTDVKLSALNEATTAWHNLNIGGNNVVLRAAGTEKARITTDGLTFNGDTAAVNALSDYEEGTWTAGIKATGTNPTVNSIINNTGVYTKIGDLVFVQIYTSAINISNGGSGSAYIDGLPFAPSASPGVAVQYSVITFTHTTALTGQIQNGYVASAYSGFFPILEGQTNATTWTTGATLYLMASGVYRTDA